MWEFRVLCEISKLLWESFCDFHRSVISIAASIFVSHHLLGQRQEGDAIDCGPSRDRRSYGRLCGRLWDRSAFDDDLALQEPEDRRLRIR